MLAQMNSRTPARWNFRAHTPFLRARVSRAIFHRLALGSETRFSNIDKPLLYLLLPLLLSSVRSPVQAGVKNNLPRGAGNFREHFGPFVRGSTSPYRRNYFNIAPTVYFVCMPRRNLTFSLSPGRRPAAPFQGKSTRERPRSSGMILVRNPPWAGSFGSCSVV